MVQDKNKTVVKDKVDSGFLSYLHYKRDLFKSSLLHNNDFDSSSQHMGSLNLIHEASGKHLVNDVATTFNVNEQVFRDRYCI